MQVLHNCPDKHNPACVNPDHLYLGTPADNARDAREMGQVPSGNEHWTKRHPEKVSRGAAIVGSRLTESDVVAIRAACPTDWAAFRSLAQRYGVTPSTIDKIVRRETWAHLP